MSISNYMTEVREVSQ